MTPEEYYNRDKKDAVVIGGVCILILLSGILTHLIFK